MAPPRKRRRDGDPLEAYRRIRKPMPQPERVIPDERRKTRERLAEREAEEEAGEAIGPPERRDVR